MAELADQPVTRSRRTYDARLNLDAARINSAGAVAGTGTPTASMGRGGTVNVLSNAEAVYSAKGAGRPSMPVAMSMADLRKAHAAGLLADGRGKVSNLSRRNEMRAAGHTTVGIEIDLSDLLRLSHRFNAIARGYTGQHAAIAMALNDGGRKLQTDLKRKLRQWTGIKRDDAIKKRMKLVAATAHKLEAKVIVRGRHLRITREDFGAAWSRANPGGTHHAWSRAQMAKGSFMAFAGRGGKYGGGLLMKREGKARKPIAPLWGPSAAREVERHRAEVERDLVGVARAKVLATAARLLEREIAKHAR